MKKLCVSLKAQRLRLLKRLQEKPATTLELRHELDILAVAPRVYELRHHYGFNIKTYWTSGYNPGGGRHRVAKYILIPGKWQENSQRDTVKVVDQVSSQSTIPKHVSFFIKKILEDDDYVAHQNN